MTASDDDWDDEEIVPLGDLRPSREHFGPLPNPAEQKARRGRSTQPQLGRPGQVRKPAGRDGARSTGSSLAKASPTPARETRRRPAQLPSGGGTRSTSRSSERPASGTGVGSNDRRSAGKPGVTSGGKGRQQRSRPNEEAFLRNLAEKHNPAPLAAKPASGWRGVVLRASGGAINLGLSAAERSELEWRKQVRRPVVDGTVAVFSRKGGVGKTTISAYLGLTLASERGGRIVALDGDAEAGSLGWLLAPKAPSTLAALASSEPMPSDYATIRRYTTSTPEGLEVIVGDPAEMGPISTIGLESLVDQLSRHYDVSVFDTGAGVTRATGRVLVNAARVLLLVMGPSVDSVRAAERTLAWLDERPGEAARVNAQVIAVINGIPSNAKQAHIDRIASHFSDRCSAVVRIPWDAHLAAGNTSVSLDRLAKPTRRAFLELAATTTRSLARPQKRTAAAGGRRAS